MLNLFESNRGGLSCTWLSCLCLIGSLLHIDVRADELFPGRMSSVITPPSSRVATESSRVTRISTSASRQLLSLARAMEKRVPRNMRGTWRIDQLVDYLNANGISTVADEISLEDVAISTSQKIEIRDVDVSLGAAITIALRKFDVDWTINSGMDCVLICSTDRSEDELITLVYDVGALVSGDDYEALLNAFTSTVAPSSWDEVGGPGSVVVLPNRRQVVISQTFQTHRQLGQLMEGMLNLGGTSRPIPHSLSRRIVGRPASTVVMLPARPKKRGIGLPNTGDSPGSFGGMGGAMGGAMGGGMAGGMF